MKSTTINLAYLQAEAIIPAGHALSTISQLSVLNSSSDGSMSIKVHKLEYFQYRIQLCAPSTTTSVGIDHSTHCREGFVLTLYLDDEREKICRFPITQVHMTDLYLIGTEKLMKITVRKHTLEEKLLDVTRKKGSDIY
ncbi:hypothetical protein L6452_21933 [Arctium lappa]|uniref:Uncharacterized protein n=1 Tax=Arctium lappa TaxID=4217 RepID=A0ACB9B2R7_ARCLA|nr:hypothetical protein L6452_21933 [Arctium lappa]